MLYFSLIHAADPQSRPVVIIVIIIFARFRMHFPNIAKQMSCENNDCRVDH